MNIKDHSGCTLLHKACDFGQLDIIKFLVSVSSVDVNSKTSGGYTPLHIACKYCYLDIVQLLMSTQQINPICTNEDGDTSLHIACSSGNVDIVKYLLSTGHIDPMSTNKNGNTPFHIACSSGNVDIVKQLLSTGHVDPMVENRQQKTPVQLTEYNYGILKLLEPFTHCRVDFPVESYSKVFLCGNTTNGKSSLAYALCQRVKSISLLERLNPFKQKEKAEPLTAGIVPHHLESMEIGNIVLYDFAGHPEYYSSHEAVLEYLMLKSPAVFIILIKLTDKLEDIDKQLYYWTGFLENVGC